MYIPLIEHERLFLTAGVNVPDIGLGVREGNYGRLIITSLRIATLLNLKDHFFSMPHHKITSFQWESGFRKGNNFKLTFFHGEKSLQLEYHTGAKKEVSRLLELMPYYDQPPVLKKWDPGIVERAHVDMPVNAMVLRFAIGEITEDELQQIKSDLMIRDGDPAPIRPG